MSILKYLIFALAFVMSINCDAQSLEQLAERANSHYDNYNFLKAAKVYQKMVDLRPDSAELQIQMASCLCRGGKRDESFQAFADIMSKGPKNAKAFLERGSCFQKFRMYDNAVQDFSEGIEHATNDTILKMLYFNRGATKSSYMDVKGALADNLKALEFDSMDIAIHNNTAIVFGDMREFEKAEYHLKKVLEIDSLFPGGLMNLGFMYSEMKEFEKALIYLDKAIESFPNKPYTYNNRGLVKHKLGKSNEGIKDIERSIKMNPSNSYAYRNLAEIYLALEQPKKACENCRKALDLNFSTNYGGEMEKFYKKHCTK